MADEDMAVIRAAKQAMRKQLTVSLSAIPDQVLATESASVTEHVLQAPWYRNADRLSCYISMPKAELRTDSIIRDALSSGKTLFVPFCPPGKDAEMRMLRLRNQEAFERMKANKWGIREFGRDEVVDLEEALEPEKGGLDLILVPGVAFDIFGGRLGHGRGYYDRYIALSEAHAKAASRPRPFLAALALSQQLLPPGYVVPMTVTDRKPDLVVTPAGEVEKSAYQGG